MAATASPPLGSDLAVEAVIAHDAYALRSAIRTHLAHQLGTRGADQAIAMALLAGRLAEVPTSKGPALRVADTPNVDRPRFTPATDHVLAALRQRDGIAWRDTIVNDVRGQIGQAGAERAITDAARAGKLEELLFASGEIALRLSERTA